MEHLIVRLCINLCRPVKTRDEESSLLVMESWIKRLHVNRTFEEAKNLEARKPVRVSTSGSIGIREFKTATNPENRECRF